MIGLDLLEQWLHAGASLTLGKNIEAMSISSFSGVGVPSQSRLGTPTPEKSGRSLATANMITDIRSPTMTTMITREVLREWGACYDDDEIASLVPPEGVTPLEVLDADIPASDRIWVMLHEEIIPAATLRLLAVRWARGALEAERAAGREPAAASWAALDVAERYARGEATAAELAIARDAAWAAADTAPDYAAWAAAWPAAAAAAEAAARAAAWAAADAAAWDAAAARDAARDAQLADVRRVLTGGEP